MTIDKLIAGCVRRYFLYRYRRRIPKLVKKMRQKETIKVLFVLSDLSFWKTERLYVAMLQHPRFEPILGTTLINVDIGSEAMRKYVALTEYLHKYGYQFVELYQQNIIEIQPDIIFYQQPYEGFVSERISYLQLTKKNALICDVHYSMHTLAIKSQSKWTIDTNLHRYCWQMYVENDITARLGILSIIKGKNIRVTGMPVQDVLSQPKESFSDPWIPQTSYEKRIIFAPHHSIPQKDYDGWISNFLDICDAMISLVKKYNNSVQFAFKPHPCLKKKLVDLWGRSKTEDYYNFWKNSDNTQLFEGDYLDLFKYSDAMIHDCDSFTLEYCYVKKPVMFVINEANIKDREDALNDFGKMAFELHDKGCSIESIESFIQSVIKGEDSKKNERDYFFNNYLLPPNHKSAVSNIIDAIICG